MTNESMRPRSIDTLRERFGEKTRVAEKAANTLSKLNIVMRQMREWRGDKARLQSKIWRLKLALRSMGTESELSPQTDPLIDHQRGEIKELEVANGVLEKEVVALKSALAEAEEDLARAAAWKLKNAMAGVREKFCTEKKRLNSEIQYLRKRLRELEDEQTDSALSRLRRKLREFTEADQTMELIVADVASKVAETVANLSEELVNVSEDLYRTESALEGRDLEVDRLRAMLRSRCENGAEYRKRASELEDLTMRLKEETDRLKCIFDHGIEVPAYAEAARNVQILIEQLAFKLRNDREALLARGNPACLRYMKKIIELRVNLRRLRGEVERSACRMRKLSGESTEGKEGKEECSSGDAHLVEALRHLDAEIDRLRIKPLTNHRGAVDGATFLRKVEKLERTVAKSKSAFAELKVDGIAVIHSAWRVDKLEDLVNELCGEIKEIETSVSPDDTSVFEIVKQMEESIVELKVEAAQKDESIDSLERQLAGMKGVVQQRTAQTKGAQEKLTKFITDYEGVQENSKRQESRITRLLEEGDDLRGRLVEMQRVKADFEDARTKLQGLEKDKLAAQVELEKTRNAVTEKNEHIVKVIMEKDSSEKMLKGEINSLTVKLAAALGESSKMKKDEERRIRSAKSVHFESERTESRNELEKLKAELIDTKTRFEDANAKMLDLGARLCNMTADRSRLEANIFNLISCKEVLRCQLDAERAATQERTRVLKRLSTENEGLRVSLDNSKVESDSLRASIDGLNNKCSALETQTDSFKSGREALEREIGCLRTNSEDLKSSLDRSRADLKIAENEIERLKSEISRAATVGSDKSHGAQNSQATDDTQAQLAEKNKPSAPANEACEPVVRDQPHKASVGHNDECLGVELNKSAHANESSTSKIPASLADLTDGEDVRTANVECRGSSSDILTGQVVDPIKDDQLRPGRNDGEPTKTKCEAGSLKDESANTRDKLYNTFLQVLRAPRRSVNLATRRKIDADPSASGGEEKTAGELVAGARCAFSAADGRSDEECTVSRDTDVGEDAIGRKKHLIEVLFRENLQSEGGVDNLRESINVSAGIYQKTRTDLRNATEEMRALKLELNRLRDEKSGLMMQLNIYKRELSRLCDEKIALKSELVNIRDANSMLRIQLNDLRIVREKLMKLKMGIKDRLMSAFREVNKYTLATERLDGFECKLKGVFQEYESAGDYEFNDRSRMNIVEADVRHIEGQSPHVSN